MPDDQPATGQLTLDEQIAVSHDRRRRMVTALLYGEDARPSTAPPGTWTPLIAGAVLALFVALIVAVVVLVRASFPATRPAPPAHPSPATVVSSR